MGGEYPEPPNRQPHNPNPHLPRHRRRRMWLRPRGMLPVHAELRYVQVRPLHRGAPHRVGTAGRRRPYLSGPDLPDPLRADRAHRQRIGGEVQMTGYQPQTMPVRVDGKGGDSRLQPNPVYVELQPAAPVKPVKPAPVAKKKTSAASPPPPRAQTQAAAPAASNGAYPAASQGDPWRPAPQ